MDEVIALLEQFVHLITSHASLDLQNTPKFHTIIRQLCESAPDIAETIAGVIQESNKLGSPKGQANKTTIPLAKRKRKPDQDPSYHPSKATKISGLPGHANKSSSDGRVAESRGAIVEDDKAP
ncbi:hypothetical protein BDV12DRAFT_200882 [Aspergillus spectabilis]